jgi:hypothetical protein
MEAQRQAANDRSKRGERFPLCRVCIAGYRGCQRPTFQTYWHIYDVREPRSILHRLELLPYHCTYFPVGLLCRILIQSMSERDKLIVFQWGWPPPLTVIRTKGKDPHIECSSATDEQAM